MASISMMIKADLKKLGANVVSVRTDRAYGLSVVIQDAKPEIRGKCRDYLDAYKLGDYNMVEDIYEYRKNKDGKPKFHFVFLSNKISDELRERAFQPFTISNLSANIRRMKLRIEQVKARQSIPAQREEINGVVIEQNPNAMRTQIRFAGKPSAETIEALKRNGFKWSPYEKVWQRLISVYGWSVAIQIVGGIKK